MAPGNTFPGKTFTLKPMKTVSRAVLTIGLIAACFFAQASEVYKWVDEDGVIHFSDKQPNFKQSEKVKVNSGKGSPNPYNPQERVEAINAQRAEANESKAEQAANEAQSKRKAEQCESIRKNLKTFAENSRIKVNEEGETRYLNPEEINEKKQRYEQLLKDHCQ